jgi:hypothetical protein
VLDIGQSLQRVLGNAEVVGAVRRLEDIVVALFQLGDAIGERLIGRQLDLVLQRRCLLLVLRLVHLTEHR